MRILFLTSNIGGGHTQAAKTLADGFSKHPLNHEVKIIDIIETFSPLLSKVVLESYLALLRHAPTLWGMFYDQFMEPKSGSDTTEILNRIISPEIMKCIDDFQPDLIVNTYALGSTVIGSLKQRKLLDIPAATIITDYNINSFWIHPGIDRYYVAADALKPLLANFNIPVDNIRPLGLPVRPVFLEAKAISPSEMRKQLELEEKNTILFMGGGLGLGDIMQIVGKIDKVLDNSQLLIACGHNKELLYNAQQLEVSNKLIPFPYTEEIDKYMQASDFIITKPGGLTLSECMVLNKPLALISPIPGQESNNQFFFLNQGIAISLPNNKYAGIIFKTFSNNKLRLESMIRLQQQLGKPNSTKDIIEDLINLVEDK